MKSASLELAQNRLADRTVLVVDDDPSVHTAIAKVLRRAGADVRTAVGIVEGIALLAAHDAAYDVVLTDLRMEPCDGRTIVSIMQMTFPEVPVLVMSAYGTDQTRAECALLGASAFLEKPIRSVALIAAMERALEDRPACAVQMP